MLTSSGSACSTKQGISCVGIWIKKKTDDKYEDVANAFARDTLISQNAFNCFVKNQSFTEEKIVAFASEIGIDPGIVVGRLQKEGYINFSWYNGLKTKYRLDV